MAFDYKKHHTRAMYAPQDYGSIKKGMSKEVNSQDEEINARKEGYTSERYVKSEYPTTFWHKETGATRIVGRIEWSVEQNDEAVAAAERDGFGREHVAAAEKKADAQLQHGGSGLMELATLIADMRANQEAILQIGDACSRMEIAVTELVAAKIAVDARLAELETAPDALAPLIKRLDQIEKELKKEHKKND